MSNTVERYLIAGPFSEEIEVLTGVTGPVDKCWSNPRDFVGAAMEAAEEKRDMISNMWPITTAFLNAIRDKKETLEDHEKPLLEFALRIEDIFFLNEDEEFCGIWPAGVTSAVFDDAEQIQPLNRSYWQRAEGGMKAFYADFICQTFAAFHKALIYEEVINRLIEMRDRVSCIYRRHNGNIVIVMEN